MAAVKADWFRANDPRVEQLDRLLEQRAVPFGGLGLESLDGFLSALAVGPVPETLDDWFPAVWGKAPPRWEGAADEAEARALLALAWESAQRRVRKADEDYVLEDALLWWLPDEPDAEHGDEVDIGAAWAGGFLDGMERHSEAWDAWIAKDDWIGEVGGIGAPVAKTEAGPPEKITALGAKASRNAWQTCWSKTTTICAS